MRHAVVNADTIRTGDEKRRAGIAGFMLDVDMMPAVFTASMAPSSSIFPPGK
jgi:hypothetical protein